MPIELWLLLFLAVIVMELFRKRWFSALIFLLMGIGMVLATIGIQAAEQNTQFRSERELQHQVGGASTKEIERELDQRIWINNLGNPSAEQHLRMMEAFPAKK